MNLFNRIFKISFYTLIVVEFLSLFIYLHSPLQPWAFFIILIIFLIVSLKKIEYGLLILLAELFVGGKGYLFWADFFGITISIRIAFFTILLMVWVIKKILSKNYRLRVTGYGLRVYGLLLIAITFGIINGLWHNSLSNVYLDANAWLFFLLLPVFATVIKSKEQLKPVLQILMAATLWLSLKTILVLYLFSHGLATIGDPFYKWIRDTGVGEITYIAGTLFRVFFQSHLYVLIGGLIVLAFIFAKKIKCGRFDLPHNIWLGIILYLSSLTILISQSRSLWVGGVAGLAFLAVIAVWKLKRQWYKVGLLIALLGLVIFSQLSVINIITGNYAGNLLADRFLKSREEAAGASRLNQLGPLTAVIFKNPIFGSGFGTEVTYKSNDPRILKTHPDGWYTTYAFEWGYLDIILKIGILGFMIYLFFIGKIFYVGFKNFNPVNFALLAGLVALCAVNIFSPYLNHPLGISWVMLAAVARAGINSGS